MIAAPLKTAWVRQLTRGLNYLGRTPPNYAGAKAEAADVIREIKADGEFPCKVAVLRQLSRVAGYADARNLRATKEEISDPLREIQAEPTLEEEVVEPPPPPPPPPEEPSGWKLLYRDTFPTLPGPFILGGDNQSSAISFSGNRAVIHLTGERYEFSMYKAAHSNTAWRLGDRYRFEGYFEYGSITLGGAGHHTTIYQFLKGIGSSGGGSPTQSLEIGNYGAGEGVYLADRGSYRKLLSTRAGQRYHLVVEVTGSTSSGSYRVYIDGAKLASSDSSITAQGSESVAKCGLYGGPGNVTWDTVSMSVPTLAGLRAFFRRLLGA